MRGWRKRHDSGITVRSTVATRRATDKSERDRLLQGWGLAMIVRMPRWFKRYLRGVAISYLTRTEDMPSVDLVILALDITPDEVDRCYHVYRHKPRESLPELWFENLGIWLKDDGSQYNGDLGRDYCYPGWFDAWRLRRAIKRWHKETGK